MENDKAKAFFILNGDDVVEQKVAATVHKMFIGYDGRQLDNQRELGAMLLGNMGVRGDLRGLLATIVNDAIRESLKQNLRVDHYYEQYNRTAGYRIRYGNDVIQQEQIKIGY